ncbi:MAG: glycosyltransferase family 2 protein [Candidatus Omnitrophica bacterium]|nr:glycosyltransferase family 2 protein [Candidatus Omnitrophota bacterium]
MKLSVIIPAYNEAATIRTILDRVMGTGYELEVIVVDDGSVDETVSIVENYGDGRIRLIKHTHNQGKGAALCTGFKEATGDVIIIQDADLEYDPSDYPKLLAPIEDGRADAVMGSRFTGEAQRVHFFWHFVGNKALTLLSNMTTNLNLNDMEVGYKVMKTEIARQIELKSRDFRCEPEIVAKLARLKCRIYEVPITYAGRSYEEGKKITWVDGVKALGAILRFAWSD